MLNSAGRRTIIRTANILIVAALAIHAGSSFVHTKASKTNVTRSSELRLVREKTDAQSLAAPLATVPDDVNWDNRFPRPGVESLQTVTSVMAVAASGEKVFVGGVFNRAGGIDANGLAVWDGTTWSSVGGGLGNDTFAVEVRAIAVKGNDVYVGGEFTTADGIVVNNIAKWDGTKWSALGSGIPLGCFSCRPAVTAILVSGNDVYVGGNFSTAGGISANNIAKWDGTSWSALGPGVGEVFYAPVSALALVGNDLYVGGGFGIAKWNGTTWSSVGQDLSGRVSALIVSGSDLYVGGSLTYLKSNRFELAHFARWDGAAWSVPSVDVNGLVLSLAVIGNDVYAGGAFALAGETRVNSVARWNGSAWSALGNGVRYDFDDRVMQVYSLTAIGDKLYVGGDFSLAGNLAAGRLGKWDGAGWSVLGKGVNGGVNTIALSGADVYLGGPEQAEGLIVNHIARWNGANWSGLGGGLNLPAKALAVGESNLYAGGDFTKAGALSLNHIAKWDGVGWSAMGDGLNGSVSSVAVAGNDLYAGGTFDIAGEMKVNGIARWDGSAWFRLGSGVSGCVGFNCKPIVQAIAVDRNDVYVGGSFSFAGSEQVNGIARWDGSNWNQLGPGMNGPVNAIAIYEGDVYAGGSFTRAGEVNTVGIARWDGHAWSAVQSGLDGPVFGLATNGTDLYVTGIFHVPGAPESRNIAKWNGRGWSALGTGISFGQFQGSGSTIACNDREVYVAGAFSIAGGKASTGFARWSIPPIQSTGPVVVAASTKGKKLFVTGSSFDNGAVILINGLKQKTANDADNPQSRLIAKKAGKKINIGDKIQVKNNDGSLSQDFIFTGQ